MGKGCEPLKILKGFFKTMYNLRKFIINNI